jgi:hypothetical protein
VYHSEKLSAFFTSSPRRVSFFAPGTAARPAPSTSDVSFDAAPVFSDSSAILVSIQRADGSRAPSLGTQSSSTRTRITTRSHSTGRGSTAITRAHSSTDASLSRLLASTTPVNGNTTSGGESMRGLLDRRVDVSATRKRQLEHSYAERAPQGNAFLVDSTRTTVSVDRTGHVPLANTTTTVPRPDRRERSVDPRPKQRASRAAVTMIFPVCLSVSLSSSRFVSFFSPRRDSNRVDKQILL